MPAHIDDGFHYAWRIQRRRKKGHEAGKPLSLHLSVDEVFGSIIDQAQQLTPASIFHRTLANLLGNQCWLPGLPPPSETLPKPFPC